MIASGHRPVPPQERKSNPALRPRALSLQHTSGASRCSMRQAIKIPFIDILRMGALGRLRVRVKRSRAFESQSRPT